VKRLVPFVLALLVLPSAALATRSPHDEQERLTRADMALAKLAAARKADLAAGWRLTRSGLPDDSGPDPCSSISPDLSAFVITGKHETSFEHGTSGAELDSDIDVFRNVRDATRDFNASATRSLLTCLKITVAKSLRQNHVQGTISSARMTRSPRVGAQSVYYRVVATITAGNGLRFPMYFDAVAFRQGRSQAVLLSIAALAPVKGQVAIARSVARRMR
jgi:hypothetical protein